MIDVGDSVKDTITGLTGIAVCRSEWLYGCIRVGVQPREANEGKVPEIVYVDEPQLKVVKRKLLKTYEDLSEPPLPTSGYRGGPSGREEHAGAGRPADEYHLEE
jgi:hypothetical protein